MKLKPQPAASFKAVLGQFPAPALRTVAAALSVPYNTVSAWKRRDFVPAPYWPRLASAAQQYKVAGVDLALLRRIGEGVAADRLAQLQQRRRAADRAAPRRAHA